MYKQLHLHLPGHFYVIHGYFLLFLHYSVFDIRPFDTVTLWHVNLSQFSSTVAIKHTYSCTHSGSGLHDVTYAWIDIREWTCTHLLTHTRDQSPQGLILTLGRNGQIGQQIPGTSPETKKVDKLHSVQCIIHWPAACCLLSGTGPPSHPASPFTTVSWQLSGQLLQ